MKDLLDGTFSLNFMYTEEKVAILKATVNDARLYINDCKLLQRDLLPIPLRRVKEEDLWGCFTTWYLYRCFSNTMPSFKEIIYNLNGMQYGGGTCLWDSQTAISLFSYGANLTDKYWLNPIEPIVYPDFVSDISDLDGKIIKPSKYNDVNFHYNKKISESFSKPFLYSKNPHVKISDWQTPEICTDGSSRKRWILKNDRYYLQKIISTPYQSGEAYKENEGKDTSLLKNTLDFIKSINNNAVSQYEFMSLVKPYGIPLIFPIIETMCFTDKNTELITAYDIVMYSPNKEKSLKQVLRENYISLGFETKHIDETEKILYLYNKEFGNEATKYENFGFILDSNTRKIIQPIFWSTLN